MVPLLTPLFFGWTISLTNRHYTEGGRGERGETEGTVSRKDGSWKRFYGVGEAEGEGRAKSGEKRKGPMKLCNSMQ